VKFSKYPKVTKKVGGGDEIPPKSGIPPRPRKVVKQSSTPSLPRIPTTTLGHHSRRSSSSTTSNESITSSSVPERKKANSAGRVHEKKEMSACITNPALNLTGTSIKQGNAESLSHKRTAINMRETLKATIQGEMHKALGEDKLMKPISAFAGYDAETRELAAVISRDIYLETPDVRWDDIIGLNEAKRLVKEAVVYPIKYPQLFTGILSPWKGLLLYGPPGTGKTLLAKAVATECNTTFFNISASTIVSKWRGDSEKLVRVLFELARFHAPSTIFMDELESIMSQRGVSGSGEHEGSRRMKTELLVQMDGLAKSSEMVFLLAASNLPWELDHAMLRRLEKRILVDLPNCEARCAMFQHYLPPTLPGGLEMHTQLQYDVLAKQTEGYSGSDVRLVCKEAAMRPLRKVFDRLEGAQSGEPKSFWVSLDIIINHSQARSQCLWLNGDITTFSG
jgi:katanin p60 ATPase-containing subunit A1